VQFVKFIGVDLHKEKLTVESIDENLDIEFISSMVTNDLVHF